jgi:hypothetical protein
LKHHLHSALASLVRCITLDGLGFFSQRAQGPPMTQRRLLSGCLFLLATAISSCHSDPYSVEVARLGPFATGADQRLTFSPDQDYWPVFTEDGNGVLYAFVQPGSTVRHRCFGLIPATGGTRSWQFCDNRFGSSDSSSSFPAYALGTDGRLLYQEAVAKNGPVISTLWLADSAHPYQRTALLTLPIDIGAATYDWLGDMSWTGPTTFIALAQLSGTFAHCHSCGPQDTLLAVGNPGVVVAGTIVGGHATLVPIPGTLGASGFSLAEGQGSVVFTKTGSRQLFRVPVGGGVAAPVATVTTNGAYELLGVTCRASSCIVADGPVVLTNTDGPIFPALGVGAFELRFVTLGDTTSRVLTTGAVFSSPKWAPSGTAVIVQTGGVLGHLQTISNGSSDLHLLPSLGQ